MRASDFDNSPEEEWERQSNGGFTDWEMDELSQQFVHPWDPDARVRLQRLSQYKL